MGTTVDELSVCHSVLKNPAWTGTLGSVVDGLLGACVVVVVVVLVPDLHAVKK